MRYRYLDYGLESDIPFPELPAAGDAGRSLTIRAASVGEFDLAFRDGDLVPRVRAGNGEPWLSIGRDGARFHLCFHGLLALSYESPRVLWRVGPECPGGDSVRHLLLDHALPLIAGHEGALVLHAGCAIVDDRAVLLAGPAGTGKSTLLAHLVASGWDAAADDAAAVLVESSQPLARPAYSGVRLWPDARAALNFGGGNAVTHRSEKTRFDSRTLPDRALPLASIYLLSAGASAPRIADVSRRDAVMRLLGNTFVLDTHDSRRAEARLDALSAIATHVPVRELHVPRRFDKLAAVRMLIERELVGAAR